jgi:uncharacterized protein YndB with AHSA1/START domain
MHTEHGTLTSRLTFVRDVKHPQEKVWRAITEPDGLATWFPSTIDGERRAGAALKFVFPFPDAPVMEGTMRAFEPMSLIEFAWGDDIVRIELTPIDGGTRLTLTDTFTDYAKAARDAGGWHASLDNLGYSLDGLPKQEDNWKTTMPWYLENFPPAATTAPVPDFVEAD